MSSLKSFVLQTVLPEKYYSRRFPQWNETSRPNQLCPWHDDSKPSLSIALNGGGARCHACDKRIGNIVHFEAQARDIGEDEAALALYSEFIRPVVPDEIFASMQMALAADRALQKVVLADTGITSQGIEMFAIGWDASTKRLAIPIFDRWGNLVNLRLYKLPRHRNAREEGLKVLNLKGYGACDLFSWPHFIEFTLDKPVFIMPSEKEMILGMQFGLQCLCATAGEEAWSETWNEHLTGYDICVVAQRDKVGQHAAAKRLASVCKVANFSCVIEPPTQHKDFADFVLKEGGQGIHLLGAFTSKLKASKVAAMMVEAPEPGDEIAAVQSRNGKHPIPSVSGPEWPRLYAEEQVELAAVGSAPDMLNCVVRTQGIIAAKATCTYTIPWRFKVKIKGDTQRFYNIPVGRLMLGFVKASDASVRLAIREILGNDKAEVEPESYVTATEIEIIPTASVDKDVRYVTQRCYFIGKSIDANVPYDLEIIPTTDPRTQETVGLVVSAKAISRALDSTTFTAEDFASLQTFQPKESETVWDKMLTLAEEISRHHTKIYNRPDWHLVALLTWLSPIGFAFPYEKETQRGWLNSLAIGDTQTGKSKVTQTFQRLFGAGAIINAENCTYVGLVGGAVKMGSGQFMLRWGRIPLCDRQLVVIEELSGLSVEEISNMSDVRSSGIARLDKGGLSAETNARTRLLALSNVRPVNKNLAGYLSGVKAIQELIGHGEDIARFDLIITLVDREVSNEVINRPFSNKGAKEAIGEGVLRKLCQFVWSLKPDQIRITTDAYFRCLDETKRLSEIYHPSVPVFKGGSGRYKIARVAAAIACLQFSWNGKAVLVNEDHVEAASKFLELLYNKPSFGYLEWSQQTFDRDGVKDTKLLDEKIRAVIRNVDKRGKVVESLIHAGKFSRDELCAIASLQFSQADDLIGVWVRERVLRKGDANTWEITLAGRDWLQTHLDDNALVD